MGVNDDAAAGVMGGGRDGNPVARDVDAQLQAALVDIGKVLDDEARRLVGDVEIDAIEAPPCW